MHQNRVFKSVNHKDFRNIKYKKDIYENIDIKFQV